MVVHVETGTAATVAQAGAPVPHHDLPQVTGPPAVLLVALAVREGGPEGGAGAGGALPLLLPDQPVARRTRAAGELSVTFLSEDINVINSSQPGHTHHS